MAITTSASRNAFQAVAWPLSQNTPTASGWLSSTMPLPSSVVSKGSWKRSISRRTSAPAPRRIGQDRLHRKTQVAIVGHLDAVVREVFGDVDVHRAGPTLEGQVHRLFQDVHR